MSETSKIGQTGGNSPLDLENETVKSNENVHWLQRLRRHNIVDLCMQLPQ